MTLRPLLLLDVDGVLNPFPELPDGFVEIDLFPEDEEPARLAAIHGDWLRELADAYDLAWATGWGEEANRLLCPFFGLPELPLVPLPSMPFEPRHKVPAVAAFAAERPAAWVDDMLGPEALAWAAARIEPTLLIDIDSATGLARANVDRLLAWAGEL